MTMQWIVVSDAAQARIFARAGAGQSLRLVDTCNHAQTRAHDGDLRTGEGSVHDSAGSAAHQPDPQTTATKKHADIFAKQVAERLKSGFNDQAFEELVIAADPSFLGRLREHLSTPLARCLIDTIDKNWAQHEQFQIERQLAGRRDN